MVWELMSGNIPNWDKNSTPPHHNGSQAALSANSLIDVLWSGKHVMQTPLLCSELSWKERDEGKEKEGEIACTYFDVIVF